MKYIKYNLLLAAFAFVALPVNATSFTPVVTDVTTEISGIETVSISEHGALQMVDAYGEMVPGFPVLPPSGQAFVTPPSVGDINENGQNDIVVVTRNTAGLYDIMVYNPSGVLQASHRPHAGDMHCAPQLASDGVTIVFEDGNRIRYEFDSAYEVIGDYSAGTDASCPETRGTTTFESYAIGTYGYGLEYTQSSHRSVMSVFSNIGHDYLSHTATTEPPTPTSSPGIIFRAETGEGRENWTIRKNGSGIADYSDGTDTYGDYLELVTNGTIDQFVYRPADGSRMAIDEPMVSMALRSEGAFILDVLVFLEDGSTRKLGYTSYEHWGTDGYFYSLTQAAAENSWLEFTRDLAADLRERYGEDAVYKSIHSIMIRGHVSVAEISAQPAEAGLTMTGTVQDEDGAPVPRVPVRTNATYGQSVLTGDDGTYRFAVVGDSMGALPTIFVDDGATYASSDSVDADTTRTQDFTATGSAIAITNGDLGLDGWTVDNRSGAANFMIQSEGDDQYFEFIGTGTTDKLRYRPADGRPFAEGLPMLSWRLRTDNPYYFNIWAHTNDGVKTLLYLSAEGSLPSHFSLGEGSIDGTFKSYTRNLQEDITAAYGDGILFESLYFMMWRGSVDLDDFMADEAPETFPILDVSESTLPEHWSVFKNRSGIAAMEVREADEAHASDYVEFIGTSADHFYYQPPEAVGEGYQTLAWESSLEGTYLLHMRVNTDEGARVITYSSIPVDAAGYIYLEDTDGWQSFERDIQADLAIHYPTATYQSIQYINVRGGGGMDKMQLIE